MIIAAAHGPSALWYATRGAGAMSLVLLTGSVVLGIGEVRRWRPTGAPRFAIAELHRWLSLLALTLLVVHVITTLLDPFPPIGVLNAVVPFVTSYRPLWLGLGTLASDLLLALVLTSLVRRRLGYGVWKRVHWLAYGCWPVALLHGLGAGSDTRTTWMLVLTLVCVAAVLAALAARLRGADARMPVRGLGAGIVAASLGLVVWAAQGPLAHGWASRAGTPASVLSAFAPRRTVPAAPPRAVTPDAFARTFVAGVSGAIRSGRSVDGTAVVDLRMTFSGGPPGVLRIRLAGTAVAGGGLQLRRSAVTLGPPGRPGEYQGRVEALQGSSLRALVGAAGHRAVRLTVDLALGAATVSGRVLGTPIGGTGT